MPFRGLFRPQAKQNVFLFSKCCLTNNLRTWGNFFVSQSKLSCMRRAARQRLPLRFRRRRKTPKIGVLSSRALFFACSGARKRMYVPQVAPITSFVIASGGPSVRCAQFRRNLCAIATLHDLFSTLMTHASPSNITAPQEGAQRRKEVPQRPGLSIGRAVHRTQNTRQQFSQGSGGRAA